LGAAAPVTSPKPDQKRRRRFEARDGGQAEGTRAVTRDVTLGTMNLVTLDVVSVPSKITSVMLTTIKHKTSCKPTLLLSSVSPYLFNTFCEVH